MSRTLILIAPLIFSMTAFGAEKFPVSCFAEDRCSKNLLIMHDWPTKSINADIAVKRLMTFMKPPEKLLKIAVIDSGFGLVDQNVEVKAGYEGTGALNLDEVGHGTAVVKAIQNVLGEAQKFTYITVYKISAPGELEGKISINAIETAVKRACDEGNKIINLSAEFDYKPSLMQSIAQKGCLLVQAGGNSKESHSNENSYFESSQLAVPLYIEGTYSSGLYPLFSSNGPITAPGVGVPLTLPSYSSIALKSSKENMGCNDNEYLLSGTSFSSPLVAGVIALEALVLSDSAEFKKSSLVDQRNILLTILRASSQPSAYADWAPPGANALNAIEMAKFWSEGKLGALRTVRNMKDSFSIVTKTFCDEPNATDLILAQEDCGVFIKNMDSFRAKLSICGEKNLELNKSLLGAYVKSGQNELSTNQLIKLGKMYPKYSDADLAENARLIYLTQIEMLKTSGYHQIYKDWLYLLIPLKTWFTGAQQFLDLKQLAAAVINGTERYQLFEYYWQETDLEKRKTSEDYRIVFNFSQKLSNQEFINLVKVVTEQTTKSSSLMGLALGLVDISDTMPSVQKQKIRAVVNALAQKITPEVGKYPGLKIDIVEELTKSFN